MADGMPGREPDEGEADAAQAFEGLRAEVATLRQGIELIYRQGQQAASAAPAPAPAAVDYSPTLGAIAKELKAVEGRLKAIEGWVEDTDENHSQDDLAKKNQAKTMRMYLEPSAKETRQ